MTAVVLCYWLLIYVIVINVRLKTFDSGVMVLQLKSQNDSDIVSSTVTMVSFSVLPVIGEFFNLSQVECHVTSIDAIIHILLFVAVIYTALCCS